MSVTQEFYCTTSGGGCGGYFVVKLNDKINGVVEVVCPKCKHKHQRSIVNGEIKENGRHSSTPKQTIEPPLPAWSKEPRSMPMHGRQIKEIRDGVLVSAGDFLAERRFELHGGMS